MQQRLHLVTLVVADVRASRTFYVEGLGWDPALEVAGEVVMLQVGERLVLSLWAEEHASSEIGPVVRGGTLPFTLAHNCASREEVDAVLATARAAGAEVTAGLAREWGGYSGYFADPDGFRWEVAHNPHPIGNLTLP
ncbi:MAG: VOC family protein [Marmoricola sp.]